MRTPPALAACLCLAAAPDIAPNPRNRCGMDLAPRGTTEVAMRAEVVEITIHDAHAAVKAVFDLENTSDRGEELEVGFPTAAYPIDRGVREGLEYHGFTDAGSIYAFRAKVDGEPVEATRKSVAKDDPRPAHRNWLCWPMRFEPNQACRVEVSYEVETKDSMYLKPHSALQPREVTYVLKTGRGWKDKIGSARVILRAAGDMTIDHVERATPEPTSVGDDAWEWRFEHFEPDQDVTVRYRAYRDAEDAVVRIRSALEEHPEYQEHRLDLAENLETLGEYGEAAAIYAELAGERLWKPIFVRCYAESIAYRTARAFHRAGDAKLAAQWAARAIPTVEERIATVRRWIEKDDDAPATLSALERVRAELEAWREQRR